MSSEALASIKAEIEYLLKLSAEEKIVRTSLLGEMGFTELKDSFIKVQNLLNRIQIADVAEIPLNRQYELNTNLKEFSAVVSNISQYGVYDGLEKRKKLVEAFTVRYELIIIDIIAAMTIIQFICPNNDITEFQIQRDKAFSEIGDVTQKSTNTANKASELLRDIENDKGRIREYLASLKSHNEEMKQTLATFKENAKDAGISKYASIFDKQSNSHKNNSIGWLLLIGALLIGLTCFGFYLLDHQLTTTTTENLVQNTIARIIIITALFYALTLSIKNYKAQKHNQVINQHRHNALNTFETFSGASNNDIQTKNAILLEATRCIFATQNSGYTTADNEQDMPSKIIEIIKSPTTKP